MTNLKEKWPYRKLWETFLDSDYNITKEEFDAAFEKQFQPDAMKYFAQTATELQKNKEKFDSKTVEKKVEESYLPKIVEEYIKSKKQVKEEPNLSDKKLDQDNVVIKKDDNKKEDAKTENPQPIQNKVEQKPVKITPIKLDKSEKKSFLSRFKNLGFSFGLFGGRRSKLKNAFNNAEFALSEGNAIITKNSKDSNLFQVTFDENSVSNVANIPLGNDCYVKAVYNKDKGAVSIISHTVFHLKDGKETKIDLNKKAGFLGRIFGYTDELEQKLGKAQALEVRKSFKDIKILACANPKYNEESKNFNVSGVAALIDGKTHGVKAGKKTATAISLALVGAGTFGVLSGIGVIPGAAAIVGAATLVGTNIAKVSKDVIDVVEPFAKDSAAIVADFAVDNSASKFLQTDVGIAAGAAIATATVGAGAIALKSASASKAKPLSNEKSK